MKGHRITPPVFGIATLAMPLNPAIAQDFDNQSVVALHEAGLGDDVLLAKIESLPCTYDVSTNALIKLGRAGVSSRVIAAMVDRCVGAAKVQGASSVGSAATVKRSPGIYIDFDATAGFDIRQIRSTVANSGNISGNGSVLFPFITTLALPGVSAKTTVPTRKPEFYFYFEAADDRVNDFGVFPSLVAQSPSEFTLMQFKVRGGQRDLVFGKAGEMDTRIGLDPKKAIPFYFDEINDGAFVIKLERELQPGEYGFLIEFRGDTYRVFDFTVK